MLDLHRIELSINHIHIHLLEYVFLGLSPKLCHVYMAYLTILSILFVHEIVDNFF